MSRVRTLVVGTIVLGLVAAGAPASASHTTATNSGSPAARGTTNFSRQESHPDQIIPFTRWRGIRHTCFLSIVQYADYIHIYTLPDCGGLAFSTALEKRTVPDSWATWGSPPDTLDATPPVLYTAGATTLRLDLDTPTKHVAMEVEPNPFEVHAITAEYFHGAKSLGTVTVEASGDAGAKLLGAKSRKKNVTSVVLTSDVDFAIAQLGVSR